MAEAEKNQNNKTSFAKNIQLDGYKENKLDQAQGLTKIHAETLAQGGQEKSATVAKTQATTSFAKEVHLDSYKQTKLDQLEKLRQTYGRAQGKGHQQSESRKEGKQESLGPKPTAEKHLRLPDSVERRAVDAKVHNDQLAQARIAAQQRAAEALKDFQNRQQQKNQTKSQAKRR